MMDDKPSAATPAFPGDEFTPLFVSCVMYDQSNRAAQQEMRRVNEEAKKLIDASESQDETFRQAAAIMKTYGLVLTYTPGAEDTRGGEK
jgi:hypothetical protein